MINCILMQGVETCWKIWLVLTGNSIMIWLLSLWHQSSNPFASSCTYLSLTFSQTKTIISLSAPPTFIQNLFLKYTKRKTQKTWCVKMMTSRQLQIFVPKIRMELGKKSFKHTACFSWNNLQKELKLSELVRIEEFEEQENSSLGQYDRYFPYSLYLL